MTEKDILELIKEDPWMMRVIQEAEKLNLKDWIIGAGFVRNKIWNHLHNINVDTGDTADIDLIYFDPKGNNESEDEELTKKLNKETNLNWEIVNEFYAHVWNKLPPFKSATDAMSHWCETATGIGVTMKGGELILITTYGIEDLVNLIIRPTPTFINNLEVIKGRIQRKHWLEKWPCLKLSPELQ